MSGPGPFFKSAGRPPNRLAPPRTTRSRSTPAATVTAATVRRSIPRGAKSASTLGAPRQPAPLKRRAASKPSAPPPSKKPRVARTAVERPASSARTPPPPPPGEPPAVAIAPMALATVKQSTVAPPLSLPPAHNLPEVAVAPEQKPADTKSTGPAPIASSSSSADTPGDNQSLQVRAAIEYIQSAPKGLGEDLLFPVSAHPRLRDLLPGQDISALIQLPRGYLSLDDTLAPLVSQTPSVSHKSIEARFDNFLAVQAHKLAEVFGQGDSADPSPGPSLELVISFFATEGQTHGSRTHSHQCDDSGCILQSCCPKEYNMSTVESYAARLALHFPDFAPVLHGKGFKKYIREGLSRQQTDGRHSLPAPPILQPHAEAVSLEGYASVKKHGAAFRSSKGRARADAAFHACRDAQDLARFAADLASGARANDISAALTKDLYFAGSGTERRFSVMSRTAKVLVPAKVWSFRSRPDSVLDPVRALNHYIETCATFGVPIGTICNGDDGAPMCSPYIFPWISQDPTSGFPMVTNRRPKRQAQTGAKWERASSTQCNAWLKRMLSALNGSISTEYTFHGTRAVAALVALANDRSIEQINKQQGWKERSDMCNRYARLQQVQYLAQQPVLRESLADTLAVDYAAFFK